MFNLCDGQNWIENQDTLFISIMGSDDCIVCSRKITTRQHALQCDKCSFWQHRVCNTGKCQFLYIFAKQKKKTKLLQIENLSSKDIWFKIMRQLAYGWIFVYHQNYAIFLLLLFDITNLIASFLLIIGDWYLYLNI